MTGATPDDTLLRCIRAVPSLAVINFDQWACTHQRSPEDIAFLVDRVATERQDIEALRARTEDVAE